MKYLYAYECEKKSLSSPAELQAAIDGNRREGRRPSYSSSMFSFSPSTPGPPSLLSPPKIRFPIIGVAPGSGSSSARVAPAVRKGQLSPHSHRGLHGGVWELGVKGLGFHVGMWEQGIGSPCWDIGFGNEAVWMCPPRLSVPSRPR